MKIGLAGGVPSFMGGGGLEIQIAMTREALLREGVSVYSAGSESPAGGVDVVHIFGADPSTWNYLRNWTNGDVPLVVSPISVFNSPIQARFERWLSSVRSFPTNAANMRAAVVKSADHVVALHEAERQWLSRSYRVPSSKISVVQNGSSAFSDGSRKTEAEPFVCCVGTVGDRKSQLALLEAWAPELPTLLIVGGMDANYSQKNLFLREVENRQNVRWVGRLNQQDVWNIQHAAIATLSFSSSEGESLALIDSLRLGRPIMVRSGSGAAELQRRYGESVLTIPDKPALLGRFVVESVGRIGIGVVTITKRPPGWPTVAKQLIEIYKPLVKGAG